MRLRRYTIVWTERNRKFTSRHKTLDEAMAQINRLTRNGLVYDEFRSTIYNPGKMFIYLLGLLFFAVWLWTLWAQMLPINGLDMVVFLALTLGFAYTLIQIVRDL